MSTFRLTILVPMVGAHGFRRTSSPCGRILARLSLVSSICPAWLRHAGLEVDIPCPDILHCLFDGWIIPHVRTSWILDRELDLLVVTCPHDLGNGFRNFVGPHPPSTVPTWATQIDPKGIWLTLMVSVGDVRPMCAPTDPVLCWLFHMEAPYGHHWHV